MKFRYDKNTERLIVHESTRIEYHQVKIWLTRKIKGYKYNPRVKMGLWDGSVSFFENGQVNLGLWKECFNACKEIETSFDIVNKEDFPLNRDITYEKVENFCKDFFKDHKFFDKKSGEWKPFMPYDYQIQSAFKILKNRYCICEVATSGGKSLITSIIIFYTLKHINPDAKFLLIVPSINLVTQFSDNIFEYYYGENKIKDVQLNGDGSPIRIDEIMSDNPKKYSGIKDANVHIGCYQSLDKWPKSFFQQFHTVAVDEAHQAKAATINKILKKTFLTAQYRFGVSGTFPPDESCEILNIQSVLGPKVAQVEASTLMADGTITPVKIKTVILNHNDLEISEKLKKAKHLDGGAIYQFEKKYIQKSTKRLDFISMLVGRSTTNILILFHTLEYGKEILEKLKANYPDKEFYYIAGDIKNKEREHVKSEMEKTDKVRVLIASYGTMSTGVSVKNIHCVIFADSFKSESLVIQSIGRSLRKIDGKMQAIIFDLVDVFDGVNPNNILYRQYIEREKLYKKRKYPFEVKKINL